MDGISAAGAIEFGQRQSRSRAPGSPTLTNPLTNPLITSTADNLLPEDVQAPAPSYLQSATRTVISTARTWTQPLNLMTYIVAPALSITAIVERGTPAGLALLVIGPGMWIGGMTYDTFQGIRSAPNSTRFLDERIHKLLFTKYPVSLGSMLISGLVATAILGR